MRTDSPSEDYFCVRAGGESHPGQSCLYYTHHIVFDRELSPADWSAFSSRVDATWNGSTWPVEEVIALAKEVAGVEVVRCEPVE